MDKKTTLKEIIELTQLTDEKLSELTGVPSDTINGIRNGGEFDSYTEKDILDYLDKVAYKYVSHIHDKEFCWFLCESKSEFPLCNKFKKINL